MFLNGPSDVHPRPFAVSTNFRRMVETIRLEMSWVVIVTVLGLVGGAPRGETPRVADSSAAGADRFFHNSVPPSSSKQNRLGKPPRTMCNVRPFNQLARDGLEIRASGL